MPILNRNVNRLPFHPVPRFTLVSSQYSCYTLRMGIKDTLFYQILDVTAWRIEPPEMFSFGQIAASVITIAAAVCAALFVTKCSRSASAHTPHSEAASRSETALVRVIAAAGLLLLILEAYKQLFLYYIVNGSCYDWWFFPFQLCSVPMYLCVMLPVLYRRRITGGSAERHSEPNGFCGRMYEAILTFLACYTFVSSVSALVYPEDFLRSYASLTVHGFVWHGILLFISLIVVFGSSNALADLSARGFLRTTVLFLCLCPAAVLINVLTEPLMQESAAPHSYAAMFYLNPYHISPQPLIGSIQEAAGIPAGLIVYICIIIVISGVFCFLWNRVRRSRQLW